MRKWIGHHTVRELAERPEVMPGLCGLCLPNRVSDWVPIYDGGPELGLISYECQRCGGIQSVKRSDVLRETASV